MALGSMAPTQLGCLEMHGTGTALGDPTEAGAMASVHGVGHGAPLAVGAAKASAGHSEAASGQVGLLTVLRRRDDAAAAGNAKLRELNPLVDERLGSRAACFVLPLHGVAARRATCGLSSFGYSGTIAHAVLAVGGVGKVSDATFALDSTQDASPPLAHRRSVFLWFEPRHPFAQRRALASGSESTVVRSSVITLQSLINDHVVQGRVIFPGAGYLEMARAAGAVALSGVFFVRPLVIESPGLLVACEISGDRFEVHSGEAVVGPTVHCSGATTGTGTGASAWRRIDCATLRAPSRVADVAALYAGFDAVGLQYGPGYRTIVQAWGNPLTALARLCVRSVHEGTQVHPADLDDALCTSGVIISSDRGSETQLPFAVDDSLLRGAPGALWAVSASSN
jgi:acyl transferase domain-containing protein